MNKACHVLFSQWLVKTDKNLDFLNKHTLKNKIYLNVIQKIIINRHRLTLLCLIVKIVFPLILLEIKTTSGMLAVFFSSPKHWILLIQSIFFYSVSFYKGNLLIYAIFVYYCEQLNALLISFGDSMLFLILQPSFRIHLAGLYLIKFHLDKRSTNHRIRWFSFLFYTLLLPKSETFILSCVERAGFTHMMFVTQFDMTG